MYTQWCLLVGVALIQEAFVEADDDVLLQEVADRPWADWGRASKLSSVVKRALKVCINKQRLLNGEKPVHQVSSPAKLLTTVFSTAIMSPAATVKESMLLRLNKCIVMIMCACCLAAMQCSYALVPASYLRYIPATYSCSSCVCKATF